MRGLLASTLLLFALGLSGAAPHRSAAPEPAAVPPPPLLTQAEAHHFSDQIVQSSRVIADNYVRPVPQHALVARALVALHEAGRAPLPQMLQGDVDTVLQGRDLGTEAMRLRRALGNIPMLRGENAIRICLKAMVAQLDPYSVYLGEDDWQQRTNQRLGVGLALAERPADGLLEVRKLTLGGPAVERGLRPGDTVLEINGESVRGLTAAQANERLLGPNETPVNLLVRPMGAQETKGFAFIRRPVREETVLGVQRGDTWDYVFDRQQRIALVRLGPLLEGTSDELRVVLAALKESDVRGLILDVRDCPGGLLEESTSVVQHFIRGGVVARAKYRDEEETFNVFHQSSFTAVPIIVLVGPETSGGGELIAAALQDHNRAAVAGQRTRGKASIQRTPSLGLGGPHAVRLTMGHFYRPSGKNLHRHPDSKLTDSWGVSPDEELDVRLSTQLRQQIRDWRLLQDLRPTNSRAALPLDHPENDPVLHTAGKYLERVMK